MGPKIAKGRSSGVIIGRRELDIHVIGASGGHQRELVQRQRPRHPSWSHKGDAVDVAPLDVLDEAVQRLVEVTVVDRDRVPVARDSAGPERQHERVVLDDRVRLGKNDMRGVIDPRSSSAISSAPAAPTISGSG